MCTYVLYVKETYKCVHMCKSTFLGVSVCCVRLFMFIYQSLLTKKFGVRSQYLCMLLYLCIYVSFGGFFTFVFGSLSTCFFRSRYLRSTHCFWVSLAGLFTYVYGSLLTYVLGCAVGIGGQHVGTVCVRHVFVTVHTYTCLFRRSLCVCVWASFDVSHWHCVPVSCVNHFTRVFVFLV